MEPPEARATGHIVPDANAPPAVSVCLDTIKNRADFLKAAKARKSAHPAFLLQARDRKDSSPAIRVGFTCSKKVGNAVARNLAKRRLRAIGRLVLPTDGKPGFDYVLVGRAEKTAQRDFEMMLGDLRLALAVIHK